MISHSVSTRVSVLLLRSEPLIGPSSDTGKRFRAGQIAVSLGESWDKEWQFISAPEGKGWASAQYLAPATEVHAPTRLLFTLEGEDPELTTKLAELQQLANAEGIEFATADFGGVRTEADTIRILKYRDDDYAVYLKNLSSGKTPIAKTTWRPINPFGTSMHNFGCARDLKIVRYPPSFSESQAQHRLGELAAECGLRWGGTFKRFDGAHMELQITLAEAKQRWLARTGR